MVGGKGAVLIIHHRLVSAELLTPAPALKPLKLPAMAPTSFIGSAFMLLDGVQPHKGRHNSPYDAAKAVLSAAGSAHKDALHLRILRRAAGTDGGLAGGVTEGSNANPAEAKLSGQMRLAAFALLAKMGVAGLFLVLGVVTRKSLLITLVFNPAQLLSGLVGMVGVAKANPFFLLLNIMVTLFCISLVAATVVLENIDIGRERAFGTTVWWSVTETT